MTNTPSPKLASNLYYFLHSGVKFELKFAVKFGIQIKKQKAKNDNRKSSLCIDML